jgi:hypothetical protein
MSNHQGSFRLITERLALRLMDNRLVAQELSISREKDDDDENHEF